MSGGGKGGEQTTEIKLPKDIEKAAKENLELAKRVGSLPYAPYFGPSVAAFTPAQNAAFKNADAAADAFGLAGSASDAMPKPQTVGGFSGYSTKPLYQQAMAQVPPEILKLYNSFFFPSNQQAAPATPSVTTTPFTALPVRRNSPAAFK